MQVDHRIEVVLGKLPVALLVVDATGQVRWANDECGRLVGRPAAGLGGQYLQQLVDSAYAGPLSTYLERLRNGESVELERIEVVNLFGGDTGAVLVSGRTAGAEDGSTLLGLVLERATSNRSDLDTVAPSWRRVLMSTLVEDVVGMGRARAGERPVRVQASLDDEITVQRPAAAQWLRTALTHLVDNAVRFTDRGEVEVAVRREGDHVVLIVSDTGRGIPQSDRNQVSRPFFVGSNAGEAGGAGLGLTAAFEMASLLGGALTIEATSEAGTRFRLDVPVSRLDTPAGATSAVKDNLTAGHVLLVEDNEINRTLAERQLERLGLSCTAVSSGEEALRWLEEHAAPDVVLMDHRLPGIDGLETTRRIRAREVGTGARLTIISMTASALQSDRAACAAVGMDDFLAKPVGLDTLRRMLRRWLPLAAAQPPGMTAGSDHLLSAGHCSDVLDRLSEELGSEDVVVSLVMTYLGELGVRVADLQEAAERGDLARARSVAHSLKSTSLLLGCDDLGGRCAAMMAIETPAELSQEMQSVAGLAGLARRQLRAWVEAQRV